MHTINLMVNGLPGHVARLIAQHAIADPRFELIPYSLTGPEITEKEITIDSLSIQLLHPEARDAQITTVIDTWDRFISIDFTHPSAVSKNTDFYCRHHLPFVMGTTGGEREQLIDIVKKSDIAAVIAPNMAKQIVGFQAMMDYAAKNFPGLFKDYSLTIKESHQQGKADTSGTAKAMVKYFNQLGIPFQEDQIQKERDPAVQTKEWGIPEQYLGGHAWHTYTLTSSDETVRFSFTHNINGREVYVHGTFDAVCFLEQKLTSNPSGVVYSMMDVLNGR